MEGDERQISSKREGDLAVAVGSVASALAEAFVSASTQLRQSYPTNLRRIFPAANMLSLAVPGASDVLVVRGTTTLNTYHRFSVLPLDDSACGRALSTGRSQTYAASGNEAWEDVRDAHGVYQCKSVMCMPILRKDMASKGDEESLGVIILGVTVPEEDISARYMYQLSLIADQLAQLLHKNRETVQYNVEQVWQPLLMPEFMAGAAARRRQRRERATSHSPFLLNFLDPALEEQFRISHARNAMLWDWRWSWAGLATFSVLSALLWNQPHASLLLLGAVLHVVPLVIQLFTTAEGYCAARDTWVLPLYLIASLMYTFVVLFAPVADADDSTIISILIFGIRLMQGCLQFVLPVRVLRWVPVVSLTTLLKFLLAVHVCATSSPAPNWSACDSAPAVRVLQLVCLQMVVPGILLVRHEKRYRLRFLKEKQYTPEDVRPAKARAGPSQL